LMWTSGVLSGAPDEGEYLIYIAWMPMLACLLKLCELTWNNSRSADAALRSPLMRYPYE
jgi:hypothetical protein